MTDFFISYTGVEHDALHVHRLVPAVAHDRLGEETRAARAAVAVRLVQRAFRFDVYEVHTLTFKGLG